MSESSQPSSSEPRPPRSHGNADRPVAARLARIERRVVLLVLVLVASLGLPHVTSLPRSPLTGELSWGWLATAGGFLFVLAAALLAIRHSIRPELDAVAREHAERGARQAERDAQHAERDAAHGVALNAAQATNQYLRDVSHELRASMQAVLGLTQLLARSPLDSNQHRQVRTIDGAARALLRIMNDLLALSGPAPHAFDVVPMGCSLHDLLRIAVDLVEASATDRGLALELRIAVELPDRVVTDAGRLQQIVLGLFRYAIETGEHGTLRIDTRAKTLGDQRFELLLAVQGPRPAQEPGAPVLPPASGALDDRAPASLAGLALAQRLAALMGGSIRQSGASAALELSLPMARIDPMPAEESAPARTSPIPLSIRLPPTVSPILVVESDARDQSEAVEVLEGLGFEVEAVSDGARALEAVKQKKYAAILLGTNVGEPAGRMGVGTAEALRGEIGSARPAIIGCSHEPPSVARERAGAQHFETIVSKPLERTALSVVLAQWLSDETHPASSGMRLSKIGALDQATKRALAVRLSAPASSLPDLEPGRRTERALELFALEVPGQLVALARAAARGRRDEVVTLAERLKERCSNCGAMKMAALCRTLEGARELSLEQLGANVKALGKAMEAVLTLLGEPTPAAIEGTPASATSDRTPELP
ncbi:MAG TPA: histidine kinase dimerization/phospho-acceptor domain-containing protein [Polyangiaceae bacterium]|nr:histidine kinase dimerization/phospho-acceptor domain-containing protein [Polyangiaceae bacterium]